MVAKRLWLVGVSSLLVACQKGDGGTGATLPPCTGGTALGLGVAAYQSIDPAPTAIAPQFVAPEASPAELSPAERFHLFLRQAERTRAYPVPSRRPRAGVQASLQGPIPPTDSGTNRTFKVCGNLKCDTLPTVRATLMKLGQHIAIYVDSAAPQPGLSQTDLDTLRAVFDTRL